MTEVIRWARKAGKTTFLIRKAAKEGGYIVCLSHQECWRVAEAAKDMNLNIAFPITFDDLIERKLHGGNCSPLHIDDADLLLKHLCDRAGTALGTTTFTADLDLDPWRP